jgi:hypothetical protein
MSCVCLTDLFLMCATCCGALPLVLKYHSAGAMETEVSSRSLGPYSCPLLLQG